jgi:HD-like signal output (HDOD) protein
VLASLYSIDVPPIAGMVPALWRNTVVTANGCRELALLLGDDDAEAAFVGGMLHNVGELALLRILAEMPERLDPSGEGLGAVAALLHGAHEDFGRAVLKRWGMPARFVRVAGAHHRPPPGPEDRVSRHRRELTLLGWGMAIERGFRYLPDHEEVDIPHLCTSLGLAVEDVEEVYSKASTW